MRAAAAAFALALSTLVAGDATAPSLRGGRGVARQGADEAPTPGAGSRPGAAAPWVAAGPDAQADNVSAGAVHASQVLLAGGWSQSDDKMFGNGTGVESINASNVGYYDQGMDAAHARCGGSGCALIVNPPGHRSINLFHIHFVHFESYGASLKSKIEGQVCGRAGWQSGDLPCGGRAAYFPGFPRVFREAMTTGSITNSSVIAWPSACGGSGTIVELAYGCSIEHQIRGDYDPNHR